jgi:shikimate dehydrogenase
MIKACVIGHPVSHSRSPLIHGYWLKLLGLEGRYEKRDIKPEDLATFLRQLPDSEFAGCNITLPHKESACAHIDVLDERARSIGAINTVYVRDGKTYATSTDGHGFAANINWHAPDFALNGINVVVLGAGGSAKAIVDELLRQGAGAIAVANRTLAKATQIAAQFGPKVVAKDLGRLDDELASANLVVNTTSAGIANNEALAVDFSKLRARTFVADINYVPLTTPFLVAAKRHGCRIVPGLGMLLHQAVPGFELWFGKRPTVTQELYTLVARDIDAGYAP